MEFSNQIHKETYKSSALDVYENLTFYIDIRTTLQMHDRTSTDKHYGSSTLLHALTNSIRHSLECGLSQNHKQHGAVLVSKQNLVVTNGFRITMQRVPSDLNLNEKQSICNSLILNLL